MVLAGKVEILSVSSELGFWLGSPEGSRCKAPKGLTGLSEIKSSFFVVGLERPSWFGPTRYSTLVDRATSASGTEDHPENDSEVVAPGTAIVGP